MSFSGMSKSSLKPHASFPEDSEGVPEPIVKLITRLTKPDALEEEGIFRISGSKASVDFIVTSLTKGTEIDLNAVKDPHNVAGALKNYLRTDPAAVIPAEALAAFVTKFAVFGPDSKTEGQETARFELYNEVLEMMPKHNRATFGYLLNYFVELLDNETYTKMGPANLAMVFAPALIGGETDNVSAAGNFATDMGIAFRFVMQGIELADFLVGGKALPEGQGGPPVPAAPKRTSSSSKGKRRSSGSKGKRRSSTGGNREMSFFPTEKKEGEVDYKGAIAQAADEAAVNAGAPALPAKPTPVRGEVDPFAPEAVQARQKIPLSFVWTPPKTKSKGLPTPDQKVAKPDMVQRGRTFNPTSAPKIGLDTIGMKPVHGGSVVGDRLTKTQAASLTEKEHGAGKVEAEARKAKAQALADERAAKAAAEKAAAEKAKQDRAQRAAPKSVKAPPAPKDLGKLAATAAGKDTALGVKGYVGGRPVFDTPAPHVDIHAKELQMGSKEKKIDTTRAAISAQLPSSAGMTLDDFGMRPAHQGEAVKRGPGNRPVTKLQEEQEKERLEAIARAQAEK